MMTEAVSAWNYDGISAVRHSVSVRVDDNALVVSETGERIPLAALVPLGDRKSLAYGHRDRQGWRIGFDAPPPPEIAARLPGQEHHGGLLDRIGVIPAILGCAAIAAVTLIGLWKGAEIVAFLVPEKWEQAYGEALTGDFGGEVCTGAAGQRALDTLATRLSADGRPTKVRVIDMNMVNAAALPGRQVILFKGLIEEAKSSDEVAGVLAHEIGHAERRHVMASLIRSFGLSVLVGGADGGTIAQALLSSGYSRAAEREADSFAVTALNRASISPNDTAGFFDRMGRAEKQFGKAANALGYISSHPLSDERRAFFIAGTRKNGGYAPAMSAAEWQALKTICPPRKKGEEDKDWFSALKRGR